MNKFKAINEARKIVREISINSTEINNKISSNKLSNRENYKLCEETFNFYKDRTFKRRTDAMKISLKLMNENNDDNSNEIRDLKKILLEIRMLNKRIS